MKKYVALLITCISIIIQSSFVSFANEKSIPDTRPTNYLFDNTNLIDDKKIENKLIDLNDKHYHSNLKPQLAIVVVKQSNQDLEEISNKIARKWKIGYSDTNVGILLFVDIKNRQMRTETSDKMSVLITDSETQILNDSLKSDFKKEQYTEGILNYISTYETMINKHLTLTNEQLNVKLENELKKDILTLIIIVSMSVLCFIVLQKSTGLSTGEFLMIALSSPYHNSGSNSGSSRTHSSSGGGFSGGGSSSSW